MSPMTIEVRDLAERLGEVVALAECGAEVIITDGTVPRARLVALLAPRLTSAPGADEGEAALIDTFLENVYRLADLGDLQGATDEIFETVDRLLLDGAFDNCNEILRRVDTNRIPPALMRSFLTITDAAKHMLPARRAYYMRVHAAFVRLKGEAGACRLLGNLE